MFEWPVILSRRLARKGCHGHSSQAGPEEAPALLDRQKRQELGQLLFYSVAYQRIKEFWVLFCFEGSPCIALAGLSPTDMPPHGTLS